MTKDKRVEVPVDLPRGLETGVFANAFRVMPDTGETFFLDFLAYSAGDNRARVVSRVRVHSSFLQAVRDRLSSVMQEQPGEKLLTFPIMVRPTNPEDMN